MELLLSAMKGKCRELSGSHPSSLVIPGRDSTRWSRRLGGAAAEDVTFPRPRPGLQQDTLHGALGEARWTPASRRR